MRIDPGLLLVTSATSLDNEYNCIPFPAPPPPAAAELLLFIFLRVSFSCILLRFGGTVEACWLRMCTVRAKLLVGFFTLGLLLLLLELLFKLLFLVFPSLARGFLVRSLIALHNNLVDLARTSGGHTSCRNLMGHTPWRLSAERTITIPPTSSPTWRKKSVRGRGEEMDSSIN